MVSGCALIFNNLLMGYGNLFKHYAGNIYPFYEQLILQTFIY